ncbi:MAG: class I adenylate-forming enzyme family protein [Phycisphaerae bacterium]
MLVTALLDANRHAPATLAVDDGRLAVSYRQLTRLASVLRGIVDRETGEPRVGIMLPAGATFPATLFGALWASRIAVPLNFLLSPEELHPIVEDAGIDIIVSIRHFADTTAQLPARTIFLDDLPLKRHMLGAIIRRTPAPPPAEPDDTAVLLYTSGTTGAPKGVQLTQRNLHSNAADTIHSLNITPGQRFLNILPPFHVYGLTGTVLVPVLLRASVFAMPRFKPMTVVNTVKTNAVSMMLAIPSMYAALLRTKSAAPDAFRSVGLAVSGGEPLPDTLRDGFQRRFGVTLHEGYGLTETSPIISTCAVDAYRQGTVGRPIRNVEVRIATTTDTHPRPTTDTATPEGEILVRGPGVMKGYYNRPDDTARVIDADGWFHTGDIGRVDADGFLSIVGRSKEMLIVGGENVYPREIEAVLERHPDVLQAAVIGAPDDRRGEVPVAFVLPRAGAGVTEPELRRCVKSTLAGFKVPRQVYVRDELPTGPTGKILKRRLRDLLP